MTTHIARWDLDKTYLRTDFDTFWALLRTALESPDRKQTHPGAATLLRETSNSGIEVHILSGSPEPMRASLERKLRMDGVVWAKFTLKRGLRDLLLLRIRALRDQLGYKLAELFRSRAELSRDAQRVNASETLVGDDAEADAFVYSLYADFLAQRIDEGVLSQVLEHGLVYGDVIDSVLGAARRVVRIAAVERILIHLDRQTPPCDFDPYGSRLVPFYNYLQAAFVLLEDGRLGPEGVVRIAAELAAHHGFDGDALARSFLELARRGHLRGSATRSLELAIESWFRQPDPIAAAELKVLLERLPGICEEVRALPRPPDRPPPDYLALVQAHRHRWRR